MLCTLHKNEFNDPPRQIKCHVISVSKCSDVATSDARWIWIISSISVFRTFVLKLLTRVREEGWRTHPLPDVLDLRSHHAALRVLVPHPVLSATVDYTTASTLQHVAEREAERQREMIGWQAVKRCVYVCVCVCVFTYPDQAYLASPNHWLSEEADVFGRTITSLPPS